MLVVVVGGAFDPTISGRRFCLVVTVGVLANAAVAVGANSLGPEQLVGLHGVLEMAVAVLGGLLAGYLAGALIGGVAAVFFVVFVAYATPTGPWLYGVPIVLLWTTIATGGGGIATVLRRRVARATAAEQLTRSRIERLYAAVEHLAAANEPGDVARVAVMEGPAGLGAQAAWLAAIDSTGLALEQLAASGFAPASVRRFRSIPLDGRTVSADVIRDGKARWFANADEVEASYPEAAAAYRELGFAASAVLPLATRGAPFGFLSLHFVEDRSFDQEERDLALAFASSAAQALERSRLFAEVSSVAGTLQRSMLPGTLPSVPGLDVVARYRPASDTLAVGGDWYEAIDLGEGRVGIAVGDVAGKGVDAAAVMGRVRTAMRAYALEHRSPAEVLRLVNSYYDRTRGDVFATTLYAVVDRDAQELRVASAGHLPPIVGDDSRMQAISMDVDPPLGTGLGDRTFRETVVPVRSGDVIILFTDGVVERRDASLDRGMEELATVATSRLRGPLEWLAEALLEAVAGEDAQDDRALLVVRLTEF